MSSRSSSLSRGALLALLLAGCGSDEARALDAGVVDGASADAAPDAPPDAACERVLLVGGTDVTTQGWTVVQLAPSTLTNGADYVQLETSTAAGGRTGGQLLLAYPGAFAAGAPFALEVVALVQTVNPHNAFDSGAAILGSFTAPFGTSAERQQMVYLDAAAVGWADDTQALAVAVADGAYHTYVLAVDATGTARLSVDGAPALTRTGFTSTGTIALGDQTNDPNVDSTLRIRSVTLLCP